MAPLTTDVGPEADARRARAARARKADRTLGGFGQLAAHGPDGLEATEAARLHVLGEDLG